MVLTSRARTSLPRTSTAPKGRPPCSIFVRARSMASCIHRSEGCDIENFLKTGHRTNFARCAHVHDSMTNHGVCTPTCTLPSLPQRNHAMKTIPTTVQPYSKSPEFTQDTIPERLRSDHHTKDETW